MVSKIAQIIDLRQETTQAAIGSYFKNTPYAHVDCENYDFSDDQKYNIKNIIHADVTRENSGWFLIIGNITSNISRIEEISKFYNTLVETCGDNTYLLLFVKGRSLAAQLAWYNDNPLIGIQPTPVNNDYKAIFRDVETFINHINTQRHVNEHQVILYGYKPYADNCYVNIDYVFDTAFHDVLEIANKKVPVISAKQMLDIDNAFVLIGLVEPSHRQEAVRFLEEKQIEYGFLEEFTTMPTSISLNSMLANSVVCYRDIRGNKFVYAGTKRVNMSIHIQPMDRCISNNSIYIGECFDCPDQSFIRLRSGNNRVYIENNVTIISGEIIIKGGQKVIIGEHSLIARNAIIRSEVSHLIFDIATTHPVNTVKRDVIIGKHVWLGEACYLSCGARIGNGTVIGARSFVSSEIPRNVVAVGSPAKVIKREIIWSRDSRDLENKKSIFDCEDQTGLMFLKSEDKE